MRHWHPTAAAQRCAALRGRRAPHPGPRPGLLRLLTSSELKLAAESAVTKYMDQAIFCPSLHVEHAQNHPCTQTTSQEERSRAMGRFAHDRAAEAHRPNRRANSRSLAHTMQWMGLSGVLRMVHTGNDLATGAGLHS